MMSGPVFRKPRPRSQSGHSLPFHRGRTAEITLPVLIRVRRGRGMMFFEAQADKAPFRQRGCGQARNEHGY